MELKKIILLTFTLSCLGLSGLYSQTVNDIDGNIYLSTTIGKQVWMAENLKTSRYNDGTEIPLVSEDKAWRALKTPGFCWLDNNIENKDKYGALYNWFTVNSRKLCPKGWHVPTNSEWITMVTFLGDPAKAADKLKEAGMAHWNNALTNATNDFDFTALPGGARYGAGDFFPIEDSFAIWWSATEHDSARAWTRCLTFRSSEVLKGYDVKQAGYSVRCIRDN